MKVLNNGSEIGRVQTIKIILSAFEIMLIQRKFNAIAKLLEEKELIEEAKALTNFANKLMTKEVVSNIADAEFELFSDAVVEMAVPKADDAEKDIERRKGDTTFG